MAEVKKWAFSGFTMKVEKVGEPGKYVIEFEGGLDYGSDGTAEPRGDRKSVQSDLEYLFMPRRAMTNSDNRFELNIMLESKVAKFENWLEKTIKEYRAVEEELP